MLWDRQLLLVEGEGPVAASPEGAAQGVVGLIGLCKRPSQISYCANTKEFDSTRLSAQE